MKIKQKTKKNGQTVYYASLYLGVDSITGKKVRTTITARTKKELQLKARQKKNEFEQEGETVYQEVKIIYFSELLDLWFDTYRLGKKPNTIRVFNNFAKNYILPRLGNIRIDKITTIMLQTVVNDWARKAHQKKNSNDRTKGVCKDYPLIFTYIRKILKYGVSLGITQANPADNVEVPRPPKLESDKKLFFTDEELKTLLAYFEKNQNTYSELYDATLCKLLLATGLRISEARALEWSDIDFTNHTILVNKTLNNYDEVNEPKTKSSIRTIDIDNATVQMLIYYQKQQRIEAMKLGRTESIVFSNFTDRYITRQALGYRLGRVMKNAGLPNVGFHAFRHTHASMLLNAGVPYKQIQLRLGHSRIEMTMNIYGHLSQESLKETARVYESTLAAIKIG
ncbi:tyrosine-type recombinase/integrase [Streptococcus suis]|uniref:Integrase n=1 Tax=Streptococcus suis TaxID=1307 RepID=A0A0Z8N8A6_STRSU|nr:site-specific integrase [Streptococcus suis]NQG46000.1 site-specific integrase [Streptococcus suis]CYW22697.1 integrase [Streptococcus suis]